MIHRSHRYRDNRYRDNRYRDNRYRDNQKTMESEDDIKAIFKCTAKISDCHIVRLSEDNYFFLQKYHTILQ